MAHPQEGMDKRGSRFAAGLLKRFPGRLLILLALLFITVGAGILYRILGNRVLESVPVDTDHLNPAWRMDELEAHQEGAADLKNSASRLQAVSRRLARRELDPNLVMEKINEREPVTRLDPAELKGLQDGLTDLAAVLADARSLADFPAERFPPVRVDVVQKSLPAYWDDVRRVTWLLRLDAELLAQEEKIDGALRSIRAGLKANRSIGDDPAMPAQMVRIANRTSAARSLERTLALGQASDEALLGAQRLIEDEAAQRLVESKPLPGPSKPSADLVPKAFTRSLAELRCAAAGLAVERYRKKYHRWPKTLQELVPNFVAAVPLDPYNAKPLHYHQFKDQAIIHSVGPEGPHNGGGFDPNNYDVPGPDLGFRLWDVPQRRQDLPNEDAPTDLGLLLADYRSYGLPLPPKEATLIRFNPYEGWSNKDKPVVHYSLGFLLPPKKGEELREVLHGTRILYSKSVEPVQVPDPRALVSGPVPAACRGVTDDPNDALVIAIQCKERGWVALAQSLLEERYPQASRHAVLKAALTRFAWEDWERRLPEEPYWSTAAAAMRRILSADLSLSTPQSRSLLRSLEAALAPRRAKTGSVEAMLDDLVEMSNREERFGYKPDPKYLRVLRQGFDAVPALLEHFDDDRLTRHTCERYGKWNRHRDRVGNIVSDLLKELACGELVTAGEHSGWRGWPGRIDRDAARNWWERVKNVGEETYLVAHALPAERDAWSAHMGAVQVLAAKYPKRLLEVYRTILDRRPTLQTWPLAPLVTSSTLAHDDKVSMLVYAAGSKNLNHRRAAIEELKTVDRERGISALIETLNGLPKTPAEPYLDCQEAWFAHVGREYDDPRVWRALEAAAKRSDVGLRIQLLLHFGGYKPEPNQRRRQLNALSAFLDDDTVRDIASDLRMYRLGSTGSEFPRLEVRDFAAMEMARLLELPIRLPRGMTKEGFEDWSSEQWAKLREQMRQAAK